MRAAGHRRRPVWLAIAALTSVGLASALQSMMMVPLIADLPEILEVSVTDVTSALTLMLLVGALATPILGKLADMYGKRRLLLIGLAVAVAADAMAVLSDSYLPLLISRGLSGFSTACVPIAISVMRDELPAPRLGPAIGLMTVTLGVGSALGMPFGGLLADAFGWQSIFALSGLFCLISLLLIAFFVGPSAVRTGGRFDLLGSTLLTIALGAMLLGISYGALWGWLSPATIAAGAVALVAFLLWLLAETRAGDPVVDIPVSLSRPVLLTNIATLLMSVGMFFNVVTTSQQAQRPVEFGGLGLDPSQTGLVMLPSGLVMLIGGPISGWIMQRWGGRTALILGGGLIAPCYLLRTVLDHSILEVIIGSVLVQLAVAFMFGATSAIVMQYVPVTQTASANSVNALARAIGNSIGSAIGAAVFGLFTVSVGAAVYPSESAIDITFVIAGTAAALGTAAVIGIPRRRPTTEVEDATAATPSARSTARAETAEAWEPGALRRPGPRAHRSRPAAPPPAGSPRR